MAKRELKKNSLNIHFFLAGIIIFIFAYQTSLFPSNLSDATTLRDKCEKDIKVLEVPVKNFGDAADLEQFSTAEKTIKMAKVMFIQTKYPEAIEMYKKYQQIQHDLYKSLAKKYTERTQKIIDDAALDLVDYVDQDKVQEYFRLANQNLVDAKRQITSGNHKNAVNLCRNAKNYAISAYKLVGIAIPENYKKDVADNDNRIFQ